MQLCSNSATTTNHTGVLLGYLKRLRLHYDIHDKSKIKQPPYFQPSRIPSSARKLGSDKGIGKASDSLFLQGYVTDPAPFAFTLKKIGGTTPRCSFSARLALALLYFRYSCPHPPRRNANLVAGDHVCGWTMIFTFRGRLSQLYAMGGKLVV